LLNLSGGEFLLGRYIEKGNDTRGVLLKITERGQKATPAWRFLVEVHQRLQTPPTEASIDLPNLRMVFPWLPSMTFVRRFDITVKRDREEILDLVVPVVQANEADLRMNPHRLPQLVDEEIGRRRVPDMAQRKADKLEKKRTAMPDYEQEIVFYGKRLWPLLETEVGERDYRMLCFSIWYFRDLEIHLPHHHRPADKAITIRHLLRFPYEWALLEQPDVRKRIHRLLDTVRHLSVIYGLAGGEGKNQLPPSPVRIAGATPSLTVMPV
jgi:hypothetical protein